LTNSIPTVMADARTYTSHPMTGKISRFTQSCSIRPVLAKDMLRLAFLNQLDAINFIEAEFKNC